MGGDGTCTNGKILFKLWGRALKKLRESNGEREKHKVKKELFLISFLAQLSSQDWLCWQWENAWMKRKREEDRDGKWKQRPWLVFVDKLFPFNFHRQACFFSFLWRNPPPAYIHPYLLNLLCGHKEETAALLVYQCSGFTIDTEANKLLLRLLPNHGQILFPSGHSSIIMLNKVGSMCR